MKTINEETHDYHFIRFHFSREFNISYMMLLNEVHRKYNKIAIYFE